MSWTKRIQHPSEVMKKGDVIQVKVIRIDHDNRRISLGFKQLSEDPWPRLSEKYKIGGECLGTIFKVLDRGVVVDLGDDVEGFVPTSQLAGKDLTDPTGVFKEGEQIPLQVLEFDPGQRKIVLSVVAYYRKRERDEFEQYLAQHKPAATNIGEAMPEAIKAQATAAASPEVAAAAAEPPSVETPSAADQAAAAAPEITGDQEEKQE